MTALNPELKQPEATQVEASPQVKVDTNLPQAKAENLPQNEPDAKEGDPNWKAFREARKKDRAEREAAERRAFEKEQEVAALKAAMEAAFSKNAPSPQAYQQYYGMNNEQQEETEDQRIEKKVNSLLAAKEAQFKQQQQEQEMREYPTKLRRDFPDFTQVCSQENLDYLDFHRPATSRALGRLPEGYDKWSDIYHAVKELIPNQANVRKDSQRADMNSSKPKSISSMTESPMGTQGRETWQDIEQRRAANWARMEKMRKTAG